MFHVYILYSPSADKYYVGQTDNLELRLLFHNELSETSYTSKYRPWELKKQIPANTRSEAVRLERIIKKRKSRKYIEGLIQYESEVERLLRLLNSTG